MPRLTAAKQRCTNPHDPQYPNYGGRGIEFRFGSVLEAGLWMLAIAVVVFGWTLFGETLSPLQLAGCLVIIAGGVSMTWLVAGRSGERVDSARPGR